MANAKHAGRMIAVFMLIQMIGGAVVNFVILGPIFSAPGYIVNAAKHSSQMGLAALLGIVAAAMSTGIAITAFPVFRRNQQAVALWLIALTVAGLSASVIESINLMSLLSLSEAYTRTSGAAPEIFATLRITVASARNWAHFFALILGGSSLFVFYWGLFRLAVIPRVLAALGLAAVLLQLTAVTMPLFGRDVVFPMLAPLGVVQLVVAGWLLVNGWHEYRQA